ncbi:MAG: Ig family protein, partial [Chthonomonadales bacterium]|nr:Ig family protein [Chthonomonadales bacterium]
ETPSPLSVAVTAGQNTPNNNFGYITPVVVVGSLSGVAYVDLNGDKTYNVGEPLLSGVVITLTKPGGATTTATTNASGYYQFTNLPAGNYTVSAPATTGGKTLVTSSPLTVTVVGGKDTPNNNFGYVTTNTTGNFTTFTQGGWGTAPHGNNPGALLVNNFVKVFGTAGVTIGGNYTYKFTSAVAVQNFLPQGGTPATFTFSATNPTARTNVFAGQVLALQLSVSFSNAGITRNGLSSLTVVSGPLAGKTVAQVLALADAVLGGNTAALPSGLTVSGLNDIVTNINQNYDNGTTDNHYLH